MGDPTPATESGSALADLEAYISFPRLTGLALSPNGERLVTTVSTRSAEGTKYVGALWEIDPAGEKPARRLTRSREGESAPVFLPDGGLLFSSRRADPDVVDPEHDTAAVWLLPVGAGEARRILDRPHGVGAVRVAGQSGRTVFAAAALPDATDAADDARLRKARKDAGVAAILHDGYPVRFWDHDLGPTRDRVFDAGEVNSQSGALTEAAELARHAEQPLSDELAIDERGTVVAFVRQRSIRPGVSRSEVVIVDAVTGAERVVVGDAEHDVTGPVFSPDGSTVACVRTQSGTRHTAPDVGLWIVDLADGRGHDPAPDFPLWPQGLVWSREGGALFFTADEQGHAPVFRLDLDRGLITRLTGSGSYSDLSVSPGDGALYALYASYERPPAPVRLDPLGADQQPVWLPAPVDPPALPGALTEVRTQADDGVPVRAWLALPAQAGPDAPAPLVLWIHGGPMGSWNTWSWRWNPWLLVARGYAVLLPDPALSTGYGRDFVQRGWAAWGDKPFSDLMSVTDAACARPDIDQRRTAAMGGSFGGYMANWVATHTDRFDAIVTHASLWNIEHMVGTTDASWYWLEQFGDPLDDPTFYTENSPHLYLRKITTPMLVIHGDKDYRVPIGQGLQLWNDLVRQAVDAKFLYFPNENHWVLTPGHARVWYETVVAFLAQHLQGQPWKRPDLL